jgi:hypothetical protein
MLPREPRHSLSRERSQIINRRKPIQEIRHGSFLVGYATRHHPNISPLAT